MEATAASIRVVLGDDHPMMRDGLARSLEAFGLSVVAQVKNGREAVAAVEEHRPDVVVLDLWMPIMDGLRATEIIRARHPSVCVAILTFDTSAEQQARAEAAGAAAVLTKDLDAARLVDSLTALAGHVPTVASHSPRSVPMDDELTLTAREIEVLRWIVSGASTVSIASSLYISAKTVKNHLASIYEKLDVGDRTQAVLVALRLGLLSLDEGRSGSGESPIATC